jgi:hypothetical protein
MLSMSSNSSAATRYFLFRYATHFGLSRSRVLGAYRILRGVDNVPDWGIVEAAQHCRLNAVTAQALGEIGSSEDEIWQAATRRLLTDIKPQKGRLPLLFDLLALARSFKRSGGASGREEARGFPQLQSGSSEDHSRRVRQRDPTALDCSVVGISSWPLLEGIGRRTQLGDLEVKAAILLYTGNIYLTQKGQCYDVEGSSSEPCDEAAALLQARIEALLQARTEALEVLLPPALDGATAVDGGATSTAALKRAVLCCQDLSAPAAAAAGAGDGNETVRRFIRRMAAVDEIVQLCQQRHALRRHQRLSGGGGQPATSRRPSFCRRITALFSGFRAPRTKFNATRSRGAIRFLRQISAALHQLSQDDTGFATLERLEVLAKNIGLPPHLFALLWDAASGDACRVFNLRAVVGESSGQRLDLAARTPDLLTLDFAAGMSAINERLDPVNNYGFEVTSGGALAVGRARLELSGRRTRTLCNVFGAPEGRVAEFARRVLLNAQLVALGEVGLAELIRLEVAEPLEGGGGDGGTAAAAARMPDWAMDVRWSGVHVPRDGGKADEAGTGAAAGMAHVKHYQPTYKTIEKVAADLLGSAGSADERAHFQQAARAFGHAGSGGSSGAMKAPETVQELLHDLIRGNSRTVVGVIEQGLTPQQQLLRDGAVSAFAAESHGAFGQRKTFGAWRTKRQFPGGFEPALNALLALQMKPSVMLGRQQPAVSRDPRVSLCKIAMAVALTRSRSLTPTAALALVDRELRVLHKTCAPGVVGRRGLKARVALQRAARKLGLSSASSGLASGGVHEQVQGLEQLLITGGGVARLQQALNAIINHAAGDGAGVQQGVRQMARRWFHRAGACAACDITLPVYTIQNHTAQRLAVSIGVDPSAAVALTALCAEGKGDMRVQNKIRPIGSLLGISAGATSGMLLLLPLLAPVETAVEMRAPAEDGAVEAVDTAVRLSTPPPMRARVVASHIQQIAERVDVPQKLLEGVMMCCTGFGPHGEELRGMKAESLSPTQRGVLVQMASNIGRTHVLSPGERLLRRDAQVLERVCKAKRAQAAFKAGAALGASEPSASAKEEGSLDTAPLAIPVESMLQLMQLMCGRLPEALVAGNQLSSDMNFGLVTLMPLVMPIAQRNMAAVRNAALLLGVAITGRLPGRAVAADHTIVSRLLLCGTGDGAALEGLLQKQAAGAEVAGKLAEAGAAARRGAMLELIGMLARAQQVANDPQHRFRLSQAWPDSGSYMGSTELLVQASRDELNANTDSLAAALNKLLVATAHKLFELDAEAQAAGALPAGAQAMVAHLLLLGHGGGVSIHAGFLSVVLFSDSGDSNSPAPGWQKEARAEGSKGCRPQPACSAAVTRMTATMLPRGLHCSAAFALPRSRFVPATSAQSLWSWRREAARRLSRLACESC